jgi:calcineurin-like phosphoesterase family protein
MIKIENKDKLFFTSDMHFGHKNIIKLCNRPFGSLEEMHERIIYNWNNTVSHDDIVFILGDLGYKTDKSWVANILSRLSGQKILIKGNHDHDKFIPYDSLHCVYSGLLDIEVSDLDVKGKYQRITLCHYPMLSWNQSHRGAWNLFGHWHTGKVVDYKEIQEVSDYVFEEYRHASKLRKFQYDVGVDGNNFTPISYNQIKKIFNYE